MKIHEYQAKGILARYGVAVPQGRAVQSVEEAVQAAAELPTSVAVVKAQIHAGGRGKGGGVKVCKNQAEVRHHADAILGMDLVTPQTDSAGQRVNTVLIEQGLNIKKELYFSALVDRGSRKVMLLASTEGGMDIEEVAATTPEKILQEVVDPALGLSPFQAQRLAFGLELHKIDPKLIRKATAFFMKLYQVFNEKDASLLEINPLLITAEHEIVALDCKMTFDDNATYRHPDVLEMRDLSEEDPTETEAENCDLNYVKLDGTIGCMVNGAGLAMGTMDILQHYGGSPANFLDVGGTATAERVENAFRLITADPNVKCILVNIFGGIVRCDIIAEGIIQAFGALDVQIPIVVRLRGSNAEKAVEIVNNSPYSGALTMETDLSLAAQKAISLSQ